MGSDVRITLITTGFVTKTEFSDSTEEDEITQRLKKIRTEEELDIPTIIRDPNYVRRRQVVTPVDRVVHNEKKSRMWFQ